MIRTYSGDFLFHCHSYVAQFTGMKGKLSVKKSVLLIVCGDNFSKQFFHFFFQLFSS